MPIALYSQGLPPMAPLIEAESFSIDQVTIAQNQTISVGQVLGSIGLVTAETVVTTAAATNAGNGPIGVVTTSSATVDGSYTIMIRGIGATAPFEVIRPNGGIDGAGKVGSNYAGQINFTLTAGGVGFSPGDYFSVLVTRPAGQAGEQFEAWNPAATDGSQTAAAVALYPAATGAGQTQRIAALRRDGSLRASDLTWSASASPAQIAHATQQLATKNIVLR